MNKIAYLECKDCGSKETFIATCVYKWLVDSKCNEITTPEMDEEPEYVCEKCGSTKVAITVPIE